MAKQIPYGHDYGNSQTDGAANVAGNWVKQSMPTVETIIDKSRYEQLEAKMAKNSVIIRMGGDQTVYLLGEEALIQSPSSMSHRGNIARYMSDSSLRALIGNACRMIPEKRISLLVTTGVPVETYVKDTNIRNLIPERLNGNYVCTVTYHNKEGIIVTEEKILDITIHKVVMEGAGAILAHGEGGQVRQCVIDSGGGTLDIYTTTGQIPIVEKCKSKDLGVENSIETLKQNFYSAYGRELDQGEARSILLAYIGVRDYAPISSRGEDISAMKQRDLAEEAIRVIGKQIQSFVSSTLKEGQTTTSVAASMKNVFLVGRGAHFYSPYLQGTFSKAQFKMVDDPGSDNAVGYAMFSSRALSNLPKKTSVS